MEWVYYLALISIIGSAILYTKTVDKLTREKASLEAYSIKLQKEIDYLLAHVPPSVSKDIHKKVWGREDHIFTI